MANINGVDFSPEQIEITCYFAQWAAKYAVHYGGDMWRYGDKSVTTEQLFEIYSKQLNG